MQKSIMLPSAVSEMIERMEQNGYEAYAVGGCVRDMLCGRIPHDWDLCTNALPQQILTCFSDCTTLTIGEKHGTITVLRENVPYEITTYRIDGAYSNHRQPEKVQFIQNLKEDLRRRDFTINAMAYHPIRGLIDLFGGKEDLIQRKIRCVGNPMERFSEDALRILRGLRFAACYAFTLEESTAMAALQLAPDLQQISTERIDSECCKLLLAPASSAASILRQFSSIWMTLFPELNPMIGFLQNHPRHRYDVWEHTLRVLEATPPDLCLRWAALLHDCGKPQTCTTDADHIDHFIGHASVSCNLARCILHRLHAENKRISKVCTLIQYHGMPLPVERKGMRRLLGKLGADTVRLLILLRRADCIGQSPQSAEEEAPKLARAEALVHTILIENDCLHIKDLAINGHDLLELGVEKGPRIGVILNSLFQLVLEEQLPNERGRLLSKAQDMLKPPQPAAPLAAQALDNSNSDTHDTTPEIPHHFS